jgi:pyridoxamine 5'-phosphate oxidase-like protein
MANEQPPARGGEQRKADVFGRLAEDEDAWVSTTGADGEPYLMPLSFAWHDGALLMCTRTSNPTAQNVLRTRRATVALGHTRDVVLIETEAEVIATHALPEPEAEAFIAKLNWDTRDRRTYSFLRFSPLAIRAWREENEIPGRELMKDGAWLF